MDYLHLLSFLSVCGFGLEAIKINDLIVPTQLQHGETNYVILDCKFELQNSNDTDGLVIKWYFRKKHLVYQWLPGKNPSAIGILKNRTDLTYTVSNDPNMKHRALKITNITTDLTGEYTCKVASYFDEASLAKTMIIYEPPKVFEFEHFENTSTFLCSVNDIFPKPTVMVYTRNNNITNLDMNDDEQNSIEEEVAVEEAYGFYNITSTFQYEPSQITEPTEFVCELRIPNTSFRQTLTKIIQPEGETASTTTEIYDYETSTISIVTPENSGWCKRPSGILLLAALLIFFWRYP